MVQSPRKNSARLSAGPCRIRLRAFRLHPFPPRPLPIAGSSGCVLSLAGFPAADPATRSPAGCGYGCGPSDCTPPLRDPCQLRVLPAVSGHSPAFRLRTLPPAALPDAAAGSSDCTLLPLLVVEGRRGRETTVCFAWGPPAPCGSGWACMEKGGMTGGRRLPGLQGEAGRMAGGGCRACEVESGSGGGRQTRLRITGRRRVTARSSHGGRPGGESSATRCAVDIFLLILPS